jgi:chondroitin AC lyase
MRALLCWLICFQMVSSSFAQNSAALDTIVGRYRQFLFTQDTGTHHTGFSPLDTAGRWADIDYSNDETGKWQVADHLKRIRQLTLSWAKPASPGYHDTTIKQQVIAALSNWLRHRYKSRNWWHNEIGVPQTTRDILVLTRDSLPAAIYRQALEVMGQYCLKGTGANLVWSADLGLHYGAFTGNAALVKKCSDTIQAIMHITTEEGVQPDYSFHQHGKRLQVYHYGGAFLLDNIRLAWQLKGTPYAFSESKTQLLADFVIEGWQWMARGINTVPGTIDRAVSRTNGLHSADIRSLVPLFIDVVPGRAAAFRQLLAIQQGRQTLRGYRYFPYSDFTAYQQAGFSFFLKTNSVRTLLTESINNENLKGGLLANGDAYFVRNGNEYFNLMPVWDWERLPGITNFTGSTKKAIQQKLFTGNVSDGQSGIAVMQVELRQNNQSLLAKKCWINHKNSTLVLMVGLQTDSLKEPAFTVMDQSRWQGPVTGSGGKAIGEGLHPFSRLPFVYHHQLAYLPLYADSIIVACKTVTGSWTGINTSEPAGRVNDKVFMPQIIHRAKDTVSGYAVVFAPGPEQAAAVAAHPPWTIIKNDRLLQAVQFADGLAAIAFYSPGLVKLSASSSIAVNRSCLVMISGQRLLISDPSHAGGTVRGRINGRPFAVQVPADGNTVPVLIPGAANK